MSFFTVSNHSCKNSWPIAMVMVALLLPAPQLRAESPGEALRLIAVTEAQQAADKREKELTEEIAKLRKKVEAAEREFVKQRLNNRSTKPDKTVNLRLQILEKENAEMKHTIDMAEAEKKLLKVQLDKEKHINNKAKVGQGRLKPKHKVVYPDKNVLVSEKVKPEDKAKNDAIKLIQDYENKKSNNDEKDKITNGYLDLLEQCKNENLVATYSYMLTHYPMIFEGDQDKRFKCIVNPTSECSRKEPEDLTTK